MKTKYRDVNGDGNCLFRAISDQMTGKESNHRKFRRDAVDYVKNNKDDFAPFIEDDWDKFLSTLGQDLGHIQKSANFYHDSSLKFLRILSYHKV